MLIRGLQNQTRSNEPFPYQGSRARLIRDLTVFISHLESVVKPGNVNFDLLNRASRAFSEILDEILEPKTASAHGDGEGEFLDPVWDLADVNLLDMDFGVMFDQWLV